VNRLSVQLIERQNITLFDGEVKEMQWQCAKEAIIIDLLKQFAPHFDPMMLCTNFMIL
jgi:hypothetical protein